MYFRSSQSHSYLKDFCAIVHRFLVADTHANLFGADILCKEISAILIAYLRLVTTQGIKLPLRSYRMKNEPFVSMNIPVLLEEYIILKSHHNMFIDEQVEFYKKLAKSPNNLEVAHPTLIPRDKYKFNKGELTITQLMRSDTEILISVSNSPPNPYLIKKGTIGTMQIDYQSNSKVSYQSYDLNSISKFRSIKLNLT